MLVLVNYISELCTFINILDPRNLLQSLCTIKNSIWSTHTRIKIIQPFQDLLITTPLHCLSGHIMMQAMRSQFHYNLILYILLSVRKFCNCLVSGHGLYYWSMESYFGVWLVYWVVLLGLGINHPFIWM